MRLIKGLLCLAAVLALGITALPPVAPRDETMAPPWPAAAATVRQRRPATATGGTSDRLDEEFVRGERQLQAGHYAEALQFFRRCDPLMKKDDRWRYLLRFYTAYCYSQLGDEANFSKLLPTREDQSVFRYCFKTEMLGRIIRKMQRQRKGLPPPPGYYWATDGDQAFVQLLQNEAYGVPHVTVQADLFRRICGQLGIEKGWTTADLGTGVGHFSFVQAEFVGPTGRVYAVEVNAAALDVVRTFAEEWGFRWIKTIHSRPDDANLPASSCNLVTMHDVYHCFGDSQQFETWAYVQNRIVPLLRTVARGLKPGGRLAIIDNVPKGSVIIQNLTQAGFRHQKTLAYGEPYGRFIYVFTH